MRPDIAVSLRASPAGAMPLRDIAFALTGQPGALTLSAFSARLPQGPLSGDATLTRTAGALRLNGRWAAGPLPFPAGGAQAQISLSAEVSGAGGDAESLAASLTGPARLTTTPLSLAGVDAGTLARVTRFAERESDSGRSFDTDRLGKLFREEAARPVALPALTLSGALVGPVLRATLPPVPAGGGSLAGTLALDLTKGSARFDGLLSAPAGADDADPAPPVPLLAEFGGKAPRLSYGLDDAAGWLALRLVAREEQAAVQTRADAFENARARARLDRKAAPRSPVISSDRFIAPRATP